MNKWPQRAALVLLTTAGAAPVAEAGKTIIEPTAHTVSIEHPTFDTAYKQFAELIRQDPIATQKIKLVHKEALPALYFAVQQFAMRTENSSRASRESIRARVARRGSEDAIIDIIRGSRTWRSFLADKDEGGALRDAVKEIAVAARGRVRVEFNPEAKKMEVVLNLSDSDIERVTSTEYREEYVELWELIDRELEMPGNEEVRGRWETLPEKAHQFFINSLWKFAVKKTLSPELSGATHVITRALSYQSEVSSHIADSFLTRKEFTEAQKGVAEELASYFSSLIGKHLSAIDEEAPKEK